MLAMTRDTIFFNNVEYDIERTQEFFRNLFANEGIEHAYYSCIMVVLSELRAGYAYEEDEFVNAPDGGYATLEHFFNEWGCHADWIEFVTEGGADNPIDMTKEDEIEDEMSELVGGAEDLITNGHFIDIPEADMMMMDEIGSFDGTASFTIDGDLL